MSDWVKEMEPPPTADRASPSKGALKEAVVKATKVVGVGGVKSTAIAGVVIAALAAWDAYNSDKSKEPPTPSPVIIKEEHTESGGLSSSDKREGSPSLLDRLDVLENGVVALEEQFVTLKIEIKPDYALLLNLSAKVDGLEKRLEQKKTTQKYIRDQESVEFTGIVVGVKDPVATNTMSSNCPPCNQFVRDLRGYGRGWTVGVNDKNNFWLARQDEPPWPTFKIVRKGRIVKRFPTGYNGNLELLLSQFPR